jgi:membrane associated rhomboid family serine protease
MFPIGDKGSRVHITPVVNYVLIAMNIAVFLYQTSLPVDAAQMRSCAEAVAGTAQGFVCEYGVVPAQITRGENLYALLTSMFMHGGWMHLIGNMAFLWVFGDNIEDAFGHLGYLVFYLVTGLFASATHIVLGPDSQIPAVGASGAISGVLGAYILFFHTNPIRVLIGWFVTIVPAWMMIGLWAVIQFVNAYGAIAMTTETGGVAYAAHAGGFAAGLIIALFVRMTMGQPEQRPATGSGRFA